MNPQPATRAVRNRASKRRDMGSFQPCGKIGMLPDNLSMRAASPAGVVPVPISMNDRDFLLASQTVLDTVRDAFDDSGLGVALLTGNVLTLEFDDGSQIIVNRHEASQEVWVAARAGGFHFRQQDGVWRDTRDQAELMERLAGLISGQAGERFSF